MIADPLVLGIISAFIIGAITLMIYMRTSRVQYEAQALIDINARMKVKSLFHGAEYLSESKTLYPGNEFYLIRAVGNHIICRDYQSGEMFFMRDYRFMEALQEARVKQFYE